MLHIMPEGKTNVLKHPNYRTIHEASDFGTYITIQKWIVQNIHIWMTYKHVLNHPDWGVSLIAGMEYGMEQWNGKWNGTVNVHSYR